MLEKIKDDLNPAQSIEDIIRELHIDGPVCNTTIEKLSYYKLFHENIFNIYEERILSIMGLFYKNKHPTNLYSFVLSQIGELYHEKYNHYLTPVQASIRNAINSKQYISISAPTSAGKSFSIKHHIYESKGDVVIVVPSRALIAEYIGTMKEHFKNDKSVMILPFVEYVFKSRILRRIFILTPERARELFIQKKIPNISLFFFDEAQISEEKERGVKFDVLVRRVEKIFPFAKLIFAHPFIDNPEAQIKKHSLSEKEAHTYSYKHNTVGKIFIQNHSNGRDYYFSPYLLDGYKLNNCIEFNGSFRDFAFDGNKTILIYVSKTSLYNGTFLNSYSNYIENLPEVNAQKALNIIANVGKLIGADQRHHSTLVYLLKKGVVIHHGSVPLDVRFLVEDFIRSGFAKICFATSTLAQGINMPFDIVWFDKMPKMPETTEQQRALAFKNLIGRSGRLTNNPKFDYGYVYTTKASSLQKHLNTDYQLSELSILETEIDPNDDDKELIESILDQNFNDELNLPQSKIERLSEQTILNSIQKVLNLTHNHTGKLGSNLRGKENAENRNLIKKALKKIFQTSLNRILNEGEDAVFSHAIELLFHLMQNRSFKEIVGIKYNFISNGGGNGKDSPKFSQRASKLPNKNLKKYSLFKKDMEAQKISYDIVVFDTYDYLDTVISYSLSDVFCGAFQNYYNITKDARAIDIINLFKYGTFNSKHILFLRYGFPAEEIATLEKCVTSITEDEIIFDNESLANCSQEIRNIIEWYLPK